MSAARPGRGRRPLRRALRRGRFRRLRAALTRLAAELERRGRREQADLAMIVAACAEELGAERRGR